MLSKKATKIDKIFVAFSENMNLTWIELKEYFFRNSSLPFPAAHSASEIRERERDASFFSWISFGHLCSHEKHSEKGILRNRPMRSLDQSESQKICGNKLCGVQNLHPLIGIEQTIIYQNLVRISSQVPITSDGPGSLDQPAEALKLVHQGVFINFTLK